MYGIYFFFYLNNYIFRIFFKNTLYKTIDEYFSTKNSTSLIYLCFEYILKNKIKNDEKTKN